MRKLLLGLLLVLSSANAQDFAAGFRGSLDFVLATQEPCPETVQKLVKAEYRPVFRLAKGHFKDLEINGCWTLQKELVYIVWENGTTLVLKASQFQKLKET